MLARCLLPSPEGRGSRSPHGFHILRHFTLSFLSTAHLAGDPSAAPSPGPKAQIPTHDVRAYRSSPCCSSPCSLQVGLWYVSLPARCFLLLFAFTQAVLCRECSSHTNLVELLHALFGLDIWPPEIPSHSPLDPFCI